MIKYKDWIKEHNIYLKSAEWKEIRQLVLKRDGFKCIECGSKIKLHVHHETYEHYKNEINYLEDLNTICEKCHSKIHNKKLFGKIKQTPKIKYKKKPKKKIKSKIEKLTKYWTSYEKLRDKKGRIKANKIFKTN